MKRIVILGGGFGGIYTALELEKRLNGNNEFEITLVNQENFFVFTPMLHEIASGDLDPSDIVSPIQTLLRKTFFFCGRIEKIDLKRREIEVYHGEDVHQHTLPYDHLVIALGGITHFYNLPGVGEGALTMKSLGDAMQLKNQLIGLFEEANFECCAEIRKKLLTFVVAGGGFAGVETIAALGDFVDEILKHYRNLSREDIRLAVVHSGAHLLPELGEKLGKYTEKILKGRGIEVILQTRVKSYLENEVLLSNDQHLEAKTLIWTAGTAPNPHVAKLPCEMVNGKIAVDRALRVLNYPGVWALGDCAAIPTGETGKYFPPTAQHATREAATIAKNILALENSRELSEFSFRTIGLLASLGRRRGVAEILGVKFSGFIAWWLWRTIYLMKLPRLQKRIRVALSWSLDLILSRDPVQLPLSNAVHSSERKQAEVPAFQMSAVG